MKTITHRKSVLSLPGSGKPYAFFALEDKTKAVFFCTVVASYTPVEDDGYPDVILCTEIRREDVRRIIHMNLIELSMFMRSNLDIYGYMGDRWRPKKQPISPIEYENIKDDWWPTTLKRLECSEEDIYGTWNP